MNTQEFLDQAFSDRGAKIFSGFSRPYYHNLMGLLHGHKYNKKAYGGMIRHSEAAMLYVWAKQLPADAVVVEIGCYSGLSTCYLAAGLAGKANSKIYTIDPFAADFGKQALRSDHCVSLDNKPSREFVLRRLHDKGFGEDRVELIEGYSQEVAMEWRRPIDFLWIDGNHEQAYQDFLDFRPSLKRNARVAMHDAHPRYGYPQVANDARKVFAVDAEWRQLEHVKSIISGIFVGS